MSNGIVSSVTRMGAYEPFDLQVSRGQIMGHTPLNIFGYGQLSATANVFSTPWENSPTTNYAFPTSAQKMYLASAGGATDAGVLISISGLDANYNPISEILALGSSSSTGVTTVNTYWRINNISTALTSPANPTGVVTLNNQATVSGATVYAQINTVTYNGSTVSIGTSQMALYTVPAGFNLYLTRFTGNSSLNGNTSEYSTWRAVAQYPSLLSSSATLIRKVVLQSPFNTFYNIQRTFPFVYPQGTDVQWQVSDSTTTQSYVGINVGGVLITADNLNTVYGG
jgi:hypothetical protein